MLTAVVTLPLWKVILRERGRRKDPKVWINHH
jgi:hypothetical protein